MLNTDSISTNNNSTLSLRIASQIGPIDLSHGRENADRQSTIE
jgi:hypothetical protein